MKEIILSQGKVALVDDEDFERVNQYKWCALKRRKAYYGLKTFYFKEGKRNILLHRFIVGNIESKMQIDHIDRNGLNCQKINLRIVTMDQNLKNKSGYSKKYKYKGIFQSGKMFNAQIGINNKHIYLGSFKTEIEAAKAYDVAAKKAFGEYAGLNFPESV